MNKTFEPLILNHPDSREETPSGVRLQNTNVVKEKLLEELVELEKQMTLLKSEGNSTDFSMLQTYREMIHDRQMFFNELTR